MKKYNVRAIVLKNLNYRDSDRLYTLFTQEYGKITAVARGVRKISSRRSGNLDTLNLVEIKITESSKGFKNIDEVKTLSSSKDIKSSYAVVMKAYYLVELVYRSMEEDSQVNEVFDLLRETLEVLDKGKVSVDLVVARFEVLFLKYLGYEINRVTKVWPVEALSVLESLGNEGYVRVESHELKTVDPIIKAHIYEYLADKLKSLEI